MKKQILITAFAVVLSISSFSQWIYFCPGSDNNRVDIGNLAVTGNAITIEALITLQEAGPTHVAYDIVSKHFDGFDCNYLLRAHAFSIRTQTGYTAVGHSMPYCFDTTYHAAGTYDGDSIKFFINGVQVASKHWTGNLQQNSHTTGIGLLFMQSNHYEQFIGYIDEVRIWNIARSADEIAANIYDLPDPTSQSGLLAYYKFEGNYLNLQGNPAYNGVRIPLGKDSMSVRMVAPVVVKPDIVSKNALVKFGIAPLKRKGRVPKREITIQLTDTIT